MIRIALLAVVLAGCANKKDEPDLPATDALLEFAARCNVDSACKSGLCFAFGNGEKHCSVRCNTADVCPEGSRGKKCNNKGYCAP